MTFHAFCNTHIIGKYWQRLGFACRPRVLLDGSAEHLGIIAYCLRCGWGLCGCNLIGTYSIICNNRWAHVLANTLLPSRLGVPQPTTPQQWKPLFTAAQQQHPDLVASAIDAVVAGQSTVNMVCSWVVKGRAHKLCTTHTLHTTGGAT